MPMPLASKKRRMPMPIAVETLLDLAFGLSRRTKTSYRLREGNTAIPGLSLVVRDAELGLSGDDQLLAAQDRRSGHRCPAARAARRSSSAAKPRHRTGADAGGNCTRRSGSGTGSCILVGDAPYYARVGFKKRAGRPVADARPGRSLSGFLYLELEPGALDATHGLVLPPHRFKEKAAGQLVCRQQCREFACRLSGLRGTTWRRSRATAGPRLASVEKNGISCKARTR